MSGNDQAFPSKDFQGLTKREYIATQILAGFAANDDTVTHMYAAEKAVELADELIKALNKNQ